MHESVNLASYASIASVRTASVRPSPQPILRYGMSRDAQDMLPRHVVADTEVGSVWLGVFPMPMMRLTSDTYELVKPIWVQIEKYGEGYLVTDEDIYRHGVGPTIEDARRNYEEILIGYFESLSRRQDRLSPRLKRHLEFLSQRIRRLE